jgi:quercetin dioxygenase-like cupin family protein
MKAAEHLKEAEVCFVCPRWVTFRPRTASELGLFIPQQRTSGDRIGMSISCPLSVIAPHGKSDQYSNHFVSSASAQLQANQEEKLMIKVLAIACVTLQVIAGSALGQQAGIKRTVLHSFDFPVGYTTVTAVVELPAGTCAGRHTHPGIDSGYVIEGDFVLKVDGKPEQKLKAGDSFETQPMTIHDACSVSGTKLVDTWVIERGKPLATPAN